MFALQARLLAEWQGVRRGEDVSMTSRRPALLVAAAVLVVSSPACWPAPSRRCRAFPGCAPRSSSARGARGARGCSGRQDPPRYLNLRCCCG